MLIVKSSNNIEGYKVILVFLSHFMLVSSLDIIPISTEYVTFQTFDFVFTYILTHAYIHTRPNLWDLILHTDLRLVFST